MKKKLTMISIMVLMMATVFLIPNTQLVNAKEQEEVAWKLVFDEHGTIMFVIDATTGKIEMANQAAAKFYGYSIKELTTMYIQDFNTLSPSEVEEQRKLVANGERNYFIFNHQIADGKIKNVEVYSFPFNDGDKTLLFSVIHDITPRVKTEKMLEVGTKLLTGVLIVIIIILLIFIKKLKDEVLKHKKTKDEIIYLSYNDELTGLYNRRFYEENFSKMDKASNLPLSIIMADVNGLKLVNDAFGHATGDALLQKVANILKSSCRDQDIIARISGDEFIILLPRTSSLQTKQLLIRIKELAEDTQLNSIQISFALGWYTKNKMEEDLYQVLEKAEEYMYRNKLFESCSTRNKIITTIIDTFYLQEEQEELHSKAVGDLSEKIGNVMNLTERECSELKMLGVLHDIGKVSIDNQILNKIDKLTAQEWEQIKRHSEIGYNIIRSANGVGNLADYILAHHENWDGSGYPKGLEREQIPIQSRIIRIAEAYHAMVSDRPYRKALTKNKAIEELKKNAGIQFDPYLVDIFIGKVFWDI